MTSPAGTTTYHYDTITGRLDKITSPEGKEFTYSYDHGQLKEMQYPNGITAHYAFDDNGNLTDLHYQRNDGSTVQRFQYSYDPNNMRTSMTDNDGTHDYAYDALYQITQATHPSVQNPLEQFSYDAAGNRLSDNVKSAYQYNELNQLTEDDSCTYDYDADGNMISKVSKTTDDSTVYTYDIENKLVQVRKPGMLAKYSYDALGRRMCKEVNGEKTQFRYDGQNLILEMNANDSITANYTFGPGIDNPLMIHRQDANYYCIKDGLPNTTALSDSVAAIAKKYQYTVFGQIIIEAGTDIASPFAYTCREYDIETGNYYYRERYYDARIGRFLSEDPIKLQGGDINFYRYVWNIPVYFLDPYGLKVGDWWDFPANIDRAREIAAEELAKRPSGHNNAEDAMRHAEWSRRMAEETNQFTACAVGFEHEIEGWLKGQDWAEGLMDIHNNSEGRKADSENRPVDPNKLYKRPGEGSKYNPY